MSTTPGPLPSLVKVNNDTWVSSHCIRTVTVKPLEWEKGSHVTLILADSCGGKVFDWVEAARYGFGPVVRKF